MPFFVSGGANITSSTQLGTGVVTGSKIAMGSDAQGDILYHNGTSYARLATGTSGYFLKTQGAAANPIWVSLIPSSRSVLLICGAMFNSVVQGTWSKNIEETASLGGYYAGNDGSAAQNDAITYPVNLQSGTYTIGCYFYRNTDRGILKLKIGSNTLTTFDMYGANAPILTLNTSVTISDDGNNELTAILDTKNASASAYNCNLIALFFIRTGA